jgi:hypothetical protein
LIDYYDTVSDPRKITYNIIHNLGNIYDDTTALIEIFRYGNYTERVYWQSIGYYTGDVIHQIGYKPEDYEPYTPPVV